jgi:hypothetical protein
MNAPRASSIASEFVAKYRARFHRDSTRAVSNRWPGHQWDGEVDRTATQIQALGARQVGEVVCVIRNPDRDLLPGTNVNVEIRSQTVDDTLTKPRYGWRTRRGRRSRG